MLVTGPGSGISRREGEAPFRSASWKRRFLCLVEILLALGIVTDWMALVLLPLLGLAADPLGSVRALAGFTTLSSCLLLALLGGLLHLRGDDPPRFLLGRRRDLRGEVRRGLLFLPLILVASYGLKSGFRHLLPGLYSGEKNILEELMRGPGDLALFMAVVLFSGGIREEIQRAFVIRRFEEGLGPAWLGAFLYAIFFGFGHLIQGRDEAIIAGVLGLLWGLVFASRRSVVAPAISHGLYDALELIRYYAFGPLRLG
jgi:membrane protease YdiL (CAAX protease family)